MASTTVLRRAISFVALTFIMLFGAPFHTAAFGPPGVESLTVHQAAIQCRTVNASPGPGSMIIVHGFYVAQHGEHYGYLLDKRGSIPASKQGQRSAVEVNRTALGSSALADKTWLLVYGQLHCPGYSPRLSAVRWQHAGPRPPVLQVYLSVKAPSVVRQGHEAAWDVTLQFGQPMPLQAYYVDFRLDGAWEDPTVRTTDGSEACGGDNVPQEPSVSHGYWRLDFGDCLAIRLVLTPTRPGHHTLTIRPFHVSINDHGMPVFSTRVEEPQHRYVWQGNVLP